MQHVTSFANCWSVSDQSLQYPAAGRWFDKRYQPHLLLLLVSRAWEAPP